MTLIRPAEATETAMAWRAALENVTGPTALILTRQALPILDRSQYPPAESLLKGAYVLWEPTAKPEALIIGTGSEVQTALDAARLLEGKGIATRVVSMPSWELFESQEQSYKEFVLPQWIPIRVSVEAGRTMGWERYVGSQGLSVGVDTFGASAPYGRIYQEYGITRERISEAVEHLIRDAHQ